MKIFVKTISVAVASTVLLVSLAAPILALTATPTPSPAPTAEPTIEPTIAPAIATTPAPQSPLRWVMTHKKISLGVLLVAAATGYGLYSLGNKNKKTTSGEEDKSEEEPKEEGETSSENEV